MRVAALAALAGVLIAFPAAAEAVPGCPAADPACPTSVETFSKNGGNVMRQPQAVEFSPDGAVVYVGDRWSYAVQRFDRNGAYLGEWGEWGTGPSRPGQTCQFQKVGGIGVDARGNLYLLDSAASRVVVCDPDGRFLRSWGPNVSGPGGATTLGVGFKGGLTVSGERVYVSDSSNHRVAIFDLAGGFRGQIGTGTPGSAAGQLHFPQGLRVAGNHLYVADDRNHRVQRFDLAQGNAFAGQIGTGEAGSGPGQLDHPYDIDIDRAGNVYVADNLNHRVSKWDSSLNPVGQWGGLGGGEGQLTNPRALAVDADVFVADTVNDRMQRFTPTGAPQRVWGESGRRNGNLVSPHGLDVDPSTGNLVVANTFETWTKRLTPAGALVSQFGGHGSFADPHDVAVDAVGTVAVADTGNNRVQHWGATNTFLRHTTGLARPRGVAFDAAGNLYVADTGNDRLRKYAPDGGLLSSWGSAGGGPGQFSEPSDLALDRAGNLYVADTGNDRIQQLDPTGAFVRSWGGAGSDGRGPGAFRRVTGVEVDAGGSVYAADAGNVLVETFSPRGEFLVKWGAYGHGPGELVQPTHVTTDAAGNVYVSDPFNNRVHRFSFAARPRATSPAPAPDAARGGEAPAAGAITGRVRSTGVRRRPSRAKVRCHGARTVRVRRTGRFRMTGLAPGTYACTATAPGHRPRRRTLTVNPGRTTAANFTLRRLRRGRR